MIISPFISRIVKCQVIKQNIMKTNFSGKNSNKTALGISFGLAIGAGLGVAIGASVNNIGLWLPVCIGLGLALGASIGGTMDAMGNKKKN